MKAASRKRILFPFLMLLFTIAAFALVLFCDFLGISPFVRLVQGTTPFYSLPLWFRYCLLHPALFKTLFRLGFGFSVLGSMFTLFLLLKTESLETAFKHLAGIGRVVLLVTVAFLVLVLAPVLVLLTLNLHSFSPAGRQLYLSHLAVDSGKGMLAISALVFVAATVLSAFTQIVARLKDMAPARQVPHVLQ